MRSQTQAHLPIFAFKPINTFPRKLDNSQIIVTERGSVPIIHSVPCDREGFASIDWVSIGIGQETLGDEYFSIDPDEAESILTYAIETFLDQHLYEIFGFGLGLKREKGMHRHKYGYVLQNDFGLVFMVYSKELLYKSMVQAVPMLEKVGKNVYMSF
jgi:hypothetical protein